MYNKKARQNRAFLLRGNERIRTAVAAFAELSLATRPRYRDCECKHTHKSIFIKP
jgi:queuine/archaeosine tRNA-ribosyltransferase